MSMLRYASGRRVPAGKNTCLAKQTEAEPLGSRLQHPFLANANERWQEGGGVGGGVGGGSRSDAHPLRQFGSIQWNFALKMGEAEADPRTIPSAREQIPSFLCF